MLLLLLFPRLLLSLIFSQACEIGRDDDDVEKPNKIIDDDVIKSKIRAKFKIQQSTVEMLPCERSS